MENTFPHEKRMGLLAKSLFALFLLMFLSGLIALPFLLRRDGNPSIGLYGLGLGTILLGCISIFSQAESTLQAHLSRWLASPRDHMLAFLLTVGCLALLLLSGYWILDSQSPRLAVLGGVVMLWSVLWLLLLGSLYWGMVGQSLKLIQPVLASIGVVVVIILLSEGVLRFYAAINPNDEPQIADVDTRPETWTFITDTPLPWAEQYWLEHGLASREVVWTPYVYWRMKPFQGQYVNIDERGVRRSLPAPRQPADLTVHFYGGSTMWGYGSRDDHTIPSELVTALDGQGIAAEVTNFGEWGYISRQDATLFDLQIGLGNIPDVAVFYWGFNDINNTFLESYIGLTGGEKDRGAQFDGGQCLVDLSLPVLANALLYKTELGAEVLRSRDILPINPAEGCALGNADWANINTQLVVKKTNDPTALAEEIQHMTRHVTALAQTYGITPIIIWQPAIFQKDPLAWYEEQIVIQERWQIFGNYYNQVDAEIRRLMSDDPHFLIWTDFFHDLDPKLILFMDKVHVTEEGNALVAEGIADHLIQEGLVN